MGHLARMQTYRPCLRQNGGFVYRIFKHALATKRGDRAIPNPICRVEIKRFKKVALYLDYVPKYFSLKQQINQRYK